MWQVYALASAFFAALVAIFIKVGVKEIDSNLATAIRTVVVLLITWGVVLFSGVHKQILDLSFKNLTFLILSGVATGLSWLFYFKALQIGDVSKVAPVDKLSVAFVIVLAFLILGETPDLKTLLGGGLIVAGAMILVIG
jgi:transporter family protein